MDRTLGILVGLFGFGSISHGFASIIPSVCKKDKRDLSEDIFLVTVEDE
jgi:hypothetical protein|tara:strand:- start:191 stop:337 length:147 start_codon:yes stop_codon:yes gene_type:complete